MEERYWLRHPSLRGHQGPFATDALRAAIASGAFPDDSYVLRDEGQDELQRQTSTGWRPAGDVLGFAPPPTRAQTPPAPTPPTPTEAAEARRRSLREGTAYTLVRTLVSLGAAAGILLSLLFMIAALAATRGAAPMTIILGTLGQILLIIVVAGLAQALLDIADSNVRRHPDAQ